MPRSEVNLAGLSRFNRALIEVTGTGVIARTVEVPATEGQNAIDAVYEFTPDLQFVGASFGEQYWEMHRTLERADKIDHPRERCPQPPRSASGLRVGATDGLAARCGRRARR
jgi:hypothetical protein